MRTNTNRRSYGSSGDDAMAALGAALQQLSAGVAEQTDRSRVRARQEAQDAETKRQHDLLDQDRDLARTDRAAASGRAARDDASQQLDQLRGDIGGGVDLDMAQLGDAIGLSEAAGRPGALQPVARAPMAGAGAAAAAMGDPISSAILGLPTAAMQFRRNPTEQKAADAERAALETKAAIERLTPTLPPNTRAAVEFGQVTGKTPTLGPDAFVTPEAAAAAEAGKRDAAFTDYTRRQRFNDGLIRGRDDGAGGGGLGRLKGDNPKMPRGVLNYLGQLTSKYGDDRAAALKELRSAIPNLQQAHPDFDLADLQRQFGAIFPKLEDDGLGLPASPTARAPGATPPAAPASSPAAAPPAGAAPAKGPARTPPPVGKQVKLRDGRTVTVTGHNPDGSFVYK